LSFSQNLVLFNLVPHAPDQAFEAFLAFGEEDGTDMGEMGLGNEALRTVSCASEMQFY
jgi:hypothetical protein